MTTPQLRPYQRAAVEFATRNLIESGNSLLVCATGGGKTAMLAKVAEFLIQNAGCRKVYCIVGTDKVNQQNKETIRKFAPGIAVSEYSGRLKSQHGRIICMMQQTANIHYMNLPAPEAVLIDECFPGDVEILTERGYIRFDELKDEKIAQYEQGRITFVRPLRKVIRNHCGSMVKWRVWRDATITMTPGHNQVFLDSNGREKTLQAQCLNWNGERFKLITGAAKRDVGRLSALEKLLIAIQADGCAVAPHNYSNYQIQLSKPRKIKRLLDILAEWGGDWSESKPAKGKRRFLIKLPDYKNKKAKLLSACFNLSDFDSRRARAFIYEMCRWDGHFNPAGIPQIYDSTIKGNTDFAAAMAFIAGFQTYQVCKKDHRKTTYKDVHRVFFQDKNTVRQTRKNKITTTYSSEKVYCVEVPTHRIIIRSHGFAFVSGNCHHARASTYESLIKYWKPKYLFGATATPDRGDKKSLATLFSNFYQISSKELIDMNYLCRPVFIPFECNIDSDADVRKSISHLPLQPGKTIHFCRNHEYAKRLYDIITGLSMECAYLRVGGDNDAEYAKFASADCNHLVNVNIATEGFDEPRIMNVVNWCSDGTRGRMIQKYGRGLRPYKTKKQCLIFDCGGNIEKYGNLEYTEILPKELVRPRGQFLRIEDLFYEKPEDISGDAPEIDTTPKFAVGAATMPYSPPDGWFSFYDADFGTVFLRLDGRYARFVDNGEIREVCIRQDNLFELDDFDLPGAKKTPTDYLNSWQLKSLTDIPTFGFSPEQADAVIAWKIWKRTK